MLIDRVDEGRFSVGELHAQPAQDAVNGGNRIAREKSWAREADP